MSALNSTYSLFGSKSIWIVNYMRYLCGKGCEESLVALSLALNVNVIPGFQSMILFLILTKNPNFSFWFSPSSPHNWDLYLVLHYFNYYIFMSSTFTFIVSARFKCCVNLNWTFQRQKKVVFFLFLNWVLFSLPSFNVLYVFMEICQPDSSIKTVFMKPEDLHMQLRNKNRSYCIWVKPWQLSCVQP